MIGNMKHLNTNLSNYNIILGSKSPRRKEILNKNNIDPAIDIISFILAIVFFAMNGLYS